MSAPILVGYDGSDNAKDAIVRAGELFPGHPAIVLNAWEPLSSVAAVPPVPGLEGALRKGLDEMDEVGAQASARLADEGAGLAKEAGLEAEAVTHRSEGRAWRSIVALARERDVLAIVVGRRGISGIEQALLGSVSGGVLRHADRPVVVIPEQD